jgi:hypothetical protein
MKIWVLKFKYGYFNVPLMDETRLYPTEKGARRTMKNFQKRDVEWPNHHYKDFELYELDAPLKRIA